MKYHKSIILFFSLLSPFLLFSQEKMDHFAKIGNMVSATRLHLLEEKVPEVLPENYLPATNNSKASFKPIHSMNTKEELQDELVKYRKQFLPFMENHAPKLKSNRIKIALDEFDWRKETATDLWILNFGIMKRKI